MCNQAEPNKIRKKNGPFTLAMGANSKFALTLNSLGFEASVSCGNFDCHEAISHFIIG
jgi:hypothetical protein